MPAQFDQTSASTCTPVTVLASKTFRYQLENINNRKQLRSSASSTVTIASSCTSYCQTTKGQPTRTVWWQLRDVKNFFLLGKAVLWIQRRQVCQWEIQGLVCWLIPEKTRFQIVQHISSELPEKWFQRQRRRYKSHYAKLLTHQGTDVTSFGLMKNILLNARYKFYDKLAQLQNMHPSSTSMQCKSNGEKPR